MSWRDLIEDEDRVIAAPFTGSPAVIVAEHGGLRAWVIDNCPRDVGWYRFRCSSGRGARVIHPNDPRPDELRFDRATGYVSGDRFIPDVPVRGMTPEQIHLLPTDEQRDHFDRVVVGRYCPGGDLIYAEPAPPLGPEEDAKRALDDGRTAPPMSGWNPGLYAAFLLEREERDRAAKARREAEARRLMGTAQGRRDLAGADFDAACAAALRVAGAEFLSSRPAGAGERAVRFRLPDLGRRFECVVDAQLSIIESGICLTDEDTGERGDRLFTLESLPSVIREAASLGVLVVFRHV